MVKDKVKSFNKFLNSIISARQFSKFNNNEAYEIIQNIYEFSNELNQDWKSIAYHISDRYNEHLNHDSNKLDSKMQLDLLYSLKYTFLLNKLSFIFNSQIIAMNSMMFQSAKDFRNYDIMVNPAKNPYINLSDESDEEDYKQFCHLKTEVNKEKEIMIKKNSVNSDYLLRQKLSMSSKNIPKIDSSARLHQDNYK